MKYLVFLCFSLMTVLSVSSCGGSKKAESKAEQPAETGQNPEKRRSPGYPEDLLAKIRTDLQLDEQQSKMLEAVNNAFVKSFRDAHDYYHGNVELAAEYWKQYDDERKKALKQVFSETQYEQYLGIVQDVKFQGKR